MEKSRIDTRASQKKVPVKKIRWGRLILALIIVAMVATMLTEFLYYYFKYNYGVRQKQVYDMKIRVGDYIGFNTDTDELNFGTVLPGGGSRRSISLVSDEPTFVIILMEGDIKKWASVSDNNFVFEGNKSVSFMVNTPEGAEKGEYVGRAIILFKKPQSQ